RALEVHRAIRFARVIAELFGGMVEGGFGLTQAPPVSGAVGDDVGGAIDRVRGDGIEGMLGAGDDGVLHAGAARTRVELLEELAGGFEIAPCFTEAVGDDPGGPPVGIMLPTSVVLLPFQRPAIGCPTRAD